MKRSDILWIIASVVLFVEPSCVIPCNVSYVDIQRYQREFEDIVSNEIGMIYVNISSPSFENISLTQKEWNKIIDWIWVTDEYKHFLSYPIDIDVFTLGLMKRNVRSLKMNASVENIENCTSDRLWVQVYQSLFEVYNKSDGYFCHRYFEDQDWKAILYRISHASIGYGFHCFQRNDSSSPFTIEKSGIIYIIISINLILFFYYPMILSPSSHEKEVDRQLLVYTKADYPYTPRRLFLYIIFKTGEIRQTANVTSRQKIAISCFAGARSSILITLVTGLAYIMKVVYIHKYNDCLPPNAFKYDEVYVFDGSSDTWFGILVLTVFGLVSLAALNSNILVLSKLLPDEFLLTDFVLLRSIPVACFMRNTQNRKENESISMQIVNRFHLLFSLKFWCKVYLLPLMVKNPCLFCFKLVFSPINFIINVCLVILFSAFPFFNQLYIQYMHFCMHVLHMFLPGYQSKFISVCVTILVLVLSGGMIFSLLYSSAMYMGMSCMVQFLIYFILVGIPHLYSTQVYIFLLLTATATYMSKFFLEFFLLYRLLLQKIIQIKGTNEIEIKYFDIIVQNCCPVTKELFFLFAKVLMTSFLLIIMYLTLDELNFLDGQNSFDLNTFLMHVFVLLTPGLLEILFFESNADKVERMHYELDGEVRNLHESYGMEHGIYENTTNDNHAQLSLCKLLYLCCCGCMDSPCDNQGHCKCCYTLEEEDENGTRSFKTTPFTLCDKGNNRGGYQHINGDEII